MITPCTPGSLACAVFSPTSVEREIDRIVGTFFDAAPFGFTPTPRNAARAGFPPINVWEDDNAFYVEAELPGFKLADLDISLVAGELTISGAREQNEPTDARVHRRERAGGRFTRTLRIGADIDPARVAATLDAGVLTITLPKAEAARPRKIEIKSA